MSQTHRGSILEAMTNTFIGLLISFITNATVFPLFGFHISASQNLGIMTIYTVISVIRSYLVRRMWNALGHKHAVVQ